MRYCPRCQVLIKEGYRCPACNSNKLREPQEGDLVMLLTATEEKCRRIGAALDDSKIPHEERVCGTEGVASAYAGDGGKCNKNVYVSYNRIQEAVDLMHSIGVTGREETDGESDEAAEMSPRKRFIVRAISVVLFILLIWAVVTVTDIAAVWVKSLLYP